MNVVGLTGPAGSGKSTVADYLVRAHGYTRLSFDGPLQAMLRTLDPYLAAGVRISDATRMHPDEAFLEMKFPEYGRLLAECRAAHEPGYWAQAAAAQMADEGGRYVFDAVSEQDEADVIRACGSWGLWQVSRPTLGDQPAKWLGEVQTLFNVTTREFLYSEVDRALRLAFSDTAPLAA